MDHPQAVALHRVLAYKDWLGLIGWAFAALAMVLAR